MERKSGKQPNKQPNRARNKQTNEKTNKKSNKKEKNYSIFAELFAYTEKVSIVILHKCPNFENNLGKFNYIKS
jgi:hypothetical protein